MSQKKFDLIIACGDSFTEGCRETLEIDDSGTWPGLVADELGIPFINLAVGGSCNLDIANQPLTHPTEDQRKLIAESTSPLILFNFTVMERIPYLSTRTGYLESCWSVLPEHMKMLNIGYMSGGLPGWVHKTFPNMDIDSHIRASEINQQINVPDMDVDNIPREIDWFVFSTMQAIRIAMNWETLIKGSTVRWGIIHTNTGNFTNNNVCDLLDQNNIIRLKYPHLDKCYNEHIGMAELQSLLYDEAFSMKEEYTISPNDIHPNAEGIKLLSDWFVWYINEKI